MKFTASDTMLAYFNTLESELNRAIALANRARANGADPRPEIEIPIAKDLADRVEKLIGVEGVAKRLRELEMTMSREEAALQVGLDVAGGKISSFESKKDAIDKAVRVAVAVLTEGVVAAPIEGIARIDLSKNDDGSDYIRIYYSGPIRSAGGTAQALSVLAADYVRRSLGISPFIPRPEEVERYVEEITAYRRVANLQYLPSDNEIRLIVKNCPICIDGEPTEEAEVEGRRDLPRIETNRIRGGMALVIAEGIALKAPKVKKHVDKLRLDGWDWLDKFNVTVKSDDTSAVLKPKDKYLQDLIAGRPVFSYPSMPGGFRLRYGRSRNTSFAAAGISPATMVIMADFIAAGTQIKVERPGKAAGIAPVDTIEGPTVRLLNGDVLRVDTQEEALRIRQSVQVILDIGELLINFGDFLENNHPLAPSSYCYEWWIQELGARTSIEPGDLKNPDQKTALSLSDTYAVPLHPKYTYLWHDISIEQYIELAEYIQKNGIYAEIVSFPLDDKIKDILEILLVPHKVRDRQIHIEEPLPLLRCLGLDCSLNKTWTEPESNIMDTVSKVSGITIRKRAPTRIGGRMGRPEKSDKREMRPAPHVLFPIGEAGGRRRSLKSAKDYVDNGEEKNSEFRVGLSVQKEKIGTITVQAGERICPLCKIRTFKNRCKCGEFTHLLLRCPSCNIEVNKPLCPKCKKETTSVTEMDIDFKSEYQLALSNVGERDVFESIKGVLGLTSKHKTPEPLEKGILRAKHDIVMFKDGTVRYDLSDLPLTHIRPDEIGVTVEKLKQLGYMYDIHGKPLAEKNQVLELKVQDIIVSKDCAEYLLKTAGFIDDLLTKYYKVEPYYSLGSIDDLIGELVIGLAPHTSAGVLGRLVGFTSASVGYAHPFFHAAKRRNCFHGDEKLLIYRGDGFELLTIRELVEHGLTGKREKDDFGTEYKEIQGLKTFAFNIKTKKFELADITHVSKHIPPEKLIEIKTKSGRKIIVTKDHPFPDKSGIKVRAEYADELLIPWNLKRPPVETKENIDLLSISDAEDIMIRTESDVFEENVPLSQISKNLGMSYKTFTNYIYRKSYPLELVNRFNPDVIDTGNYLIGSRRDKVSIKPSITVDEDFLSLLGFYLAEGFIKKNQINCHQVSVTATKEWTKRILKEKINAVFGLCPSISGNHVTICSRFVYELFEKLKVGKDAKTKRVPNFVYSLPEDKISAFLRGYFTGDGSCSLQSTLEVNLTSVNKWLIDGVSFLLMFSGIKHSIYEEERAVKSNLILKFYGKPKLIHSYKIRIYGSEARRFIEDIGFLGEKQKHAEELLKKWLAKKGRSRTCFDEDVFIDKVVERKEISSQDKYVYNLTVDTHHSLICSGITTFQCDGDEDCVMLLMDGLLNFSRSYLPDKRGGQMDAPLVLTSRIDPNEVDKEAHNIDVLFQYPLEFYEATLEYKNPKDLARLIDTVSGRLGTPGQYEGFGFTHDTTNIAAGPKNSAYKTLGSMIEKMDAQLALARKIKAVDAQDVAERIINSHFLPDLIGNLRQFSKQKVRCTKCNAKYRRPPLRGNCSKCGGNIVLTVHEGSVRKYLETSIRIADEYNVRKYTKQRLELLELEMRSLFESDKVKQKGLADFM
ncbi:DNA polymerase type II, large subunit [Candidatus Methanoperedens nitroreducens]|uniref:DNA polymerase II large subunit n=1 Tax=Candidatus Methanoperedens nitratireducens TaxID=1392998 RepID=A0A062VD82_9EURY|nr:DNA polymerase II large subunit [Candidatus Methanoperedens nitroreducens]KCZ73624.1 DNA polymerase type II, large subunit [Candidatus Methanoperedens nitroreducens]MDJ1422419.1 DNA polymerase II large subunit [Candidatus Methanoperedens sp.]